MPLPTAVSKFIDRYFQIDAIQEAKSAQQSVWIIHVKEVLESGPLHIHMAETWQKALTRGRNHLVIRQWKAGARWWNLHQAKNVLELARAELSGYEQASKIFNTEDSLLRIPLILHQELYPEITWAVLEYVGPESAMFDDKHCVYDDSKIQQMIRIRFEFGFDEPHPRWGRLPPTDECCLSYALMLIDQVILPIHQQQQGQGIQIMEMAADRADIFQYSSMISTYEKALMDIQKSLAQQSTEMSEKFARWISTLAQAIERLKLFSRSISPLPAVLVHMDLQPQNLLMGKIAKSKQLVVRSVLDWEDCALADPRFDLLMICRKVVANKTQAMAIWKHYEVKTHRNLGPIEVWLQLETTHSITTLLSQKMNLLGGGRNPWETETDLWGKLERESQRLDNP
jgi:hypothetical protein